MNKHLEQLSPLPQYSQNETACSPEHSTLFNCLSPASSSLHKHLTTHSKHHCLPLLPIVKQHPRKVLGEKEKSKARWTFTVFWPHSIYFTLFCKCHIHGLNLVPSYLVAHSKLTTNVNSKPTNAKLKFLHFHLL